MGDGADELGFAYAAVRASYGACQVTSAADPALLHGVSVTSAVAASSSCRAGSMVQARCGLAAVRSGWRAGQVRRDSSGAQG